jgi:HlyD family secretion protein
VSVIAKLRAKDDSSDAGVGAETPLSPMDRRVRPRRITWAGVAGGLVVVAALGAGGYGYVRYGLTRTLSVAAERVTVSAVRAAPFSDYAPVTGNIAPEDTVYLDVINGGQVTEVMAEEGALVDAGEPLARLKNTGLELQVLGLETQISEQQNNFATLRLQFEQNALRYERDLMSLDFQIDLLSDRLGRFRAVETQSRPASEISDLEKEIAFNVAQKAVVERAQAADAELAERTLAQFESQIEQMSARLGLAVESLGDLTLTAPIAGQLTIFDLDVGAVVGPGQRIGQVDAVGGFKITALVDEFYLGRIAIGQSASVEIAGRDLPLEVAKVYPNVRDRQFQVDLAFVGGPPEGLRRGQTVRPRIELGETEDSLVIANGPYYDETGGLWVLVLSPDGATATRRDVTLGRRNPEVVEVLSGLVEGEKVITSSYESFRDVERIDFN